MAYFMTEVENDPRVPRGIMQLMHAINETYQSDTGRLVSSICVGLWGAGVILMPTDDAKVPQDKYFPADRSVARRIWKGEMIANLTDSSSWLP